MTTGPIEVAVSAAPRSAAVSVTIPQPSARVAASSSGPAEKKTWGIGGRYREQLEAQKQQNKGVVSGQSTGQLWFQVSQSVAACFT